MSFPAAVEPYEFLNPVRGNQWKVKGNNMTTSARDCADVYLVSHTVLSSTVDTLPSLGVWERVKAGTFDIMFPELHLFFN